MAWLNPALAQWELYELHASTAELTPCVIGDDGNLAIQIPHAFDPQAALERSATASSPDLLCIETKSSSAPA
jgi:hypothetical protein